MKTGYDKKTFQLKSIVRIVAMSALCISLLSCKNNPAVNNNRPNIVLIVTDDQDFDSINKMPKMKSLLINNGITFTNAFVASPLCVPSRASILRGQYVHSHGAGVTEPLELAIKDLEDKTIATILQASGYKTALMGKYFNGYKPKNIPPGWDEWYEIITDNVYYDYQLNENGKYVYYGNNQTDYISDVLKEKAVNFIQRSNKNAPFFLYFSTVAPHVPVVPAKEYLNLFEDEEISFSFEKDISDKPAWVRNLYAMNEQFDKPFFSINSTDTNKAQEWYRNRWRTLQSIDDSIAAIFNTLKEINQLDNTFVLFVSDNGDGLTKHVQVSAKLSPYEEGIHVPFVVFGPSIPKGEKREHVVSTIDLLPTIAEIAGAKLPYCIDGLSLAPLLTSTPTSKKEWRDSVVAELGPINELAWPWKSVPPMYRLIRADKYKYIEYITGEKEYYDLIIDPDEMENKYDRLTFSEKEILSIKMQQNVKWDIWDFNLPNVDHDVNRAK